MSTQKSNFDPLAVSVLVAAEMIGVSRATLYRLIADGRIKVRKVGKRTLILVSEIHAFLATSPSA